MRSVFVVFLACAAFLAACGDKAAPAAAPSGPIVGALELPIALRSKGAAPAGAASVEISPTEIHVAGQPVLTLAGAQVAAADRQGDQLPKLAAALSSGPHSALALTVASGIPYETVALVLGTAKAAGVGSVAFQVRPPGGTTAGGWLALDALDVGPKTKTDQPSALPGVSPRPWGDFTSKWEEVQNACRASPTGSCAFKPESVAEGGDLKLVLHAAGQGVNVEFFRIGPPPEPTAAPAEAGKPTKGKAKAKKKKKVEMIDGVPPPKDVVDEALNAPPATEALFQFRAQEAVNSPSAVTETIKPVCGSSSCGVSVQAEKATLFVRVASLLGAAFPDGTPTPRVVFEQP